MGRPVIFFQQIFGPPATRESLQFKPTGREHAKARGRFAKACWRKFVIRRDESARSGEPGLQQTLCSVIKAAGNLLALRTVEFEVTMIAAVLDDMVSGILQNIVDE